MTAVRPDLPSTVDSTMLAAFRACPQKFNWEYVHKLAPSTLSIDLHAGGVFASDLEVVYQEMLQHKKPFDHAMMAMEANHEIRWGDVEAPEKSPKTKDRMVEAVYDYMREYPPEHDPLQPFMLEGRPTFEFSFAIPLTREFTGIDWPLHPTTGEPFIYAGRFDTLGTYHGMTVIKDDKTMKATPSNWSETFDLRGQFLGYCWASQLLGIPVSTVLVRGIVILKTKFHQIQAIKSYPQSRIERWLFQTRRDMYRMVHNYEEGYFDYNLSDSCTSYGGCAFNLLCTSEQPENWYSHYRRRLWNPLTRTEDEVPDAPSAPKL